MSSNCGSFDKLVPWSKFLLNYLCWRFLVGSLCHVSGCNHLCEIPGMRSLCHLLIIFQGYESYSICSHHGGKQQSLRVLGSWSKETWLLGWIALRQLNILWWNQTHLLLRLFPTSLRIKPYVYLIPWSRHFLGKQLRLIIQRSDFWYQRLETLSKFRIFLLGWCRSHTSGCRF
jgi:hypothetical protein